MKANILRRNKMAKKVTYIDITGDKQTSKETGDRPDLASKRTSDRPDLASKTTHDTGKSAHSK